MTVFICDYSNQWQFEEAKKRKGKPVNADFQKNLKYEYSTWTFVYSRVISMISHMLFSFVCFLNTVQ